MSSEGSTTIEVAVPGGTTYPVLVEGGALARLCQELERFLPAHRYAVIADDRVAELYGERVLVALGAAGLPAELLRFEAGEARKTRETWAALTDTMLARGFGRDAAVLALGGGVTGDLAGFVAATYLRGLPLAQLPTSLLAMVDSAVGGKTGVDTPAGKNLVGSFHPPRLVLADTETLATLPEEHLRAGLAEALKHGAIADAGYLEWIESSLPGLISGDPVLLAALVRRSVEIKGGIVARDEREGGPRKALNFGHTIGHAVEALSGYRLLHGAAVAIGMAAEARLGEALGVSAAGTATRLERALRGAGLPTELPPEMDRREVLALTRHDKKARGGRVEYVLLERIGSAVWGVAAADAEVLEALGGEG